MSEKKYEVFLKSVEYGNFTRVAEIMNYTQSGISHTIAALEEELGLRLLVRSRGGVTLTADGRELLPYIRTLYNNENQLKEKAASLRGLETGVVRVVSFASVEVHWMPHIIKSFREENPTVEVELLYATLNSEIEALVMDGVADCGFVVLPTATAMGTWFLYRDQWRVIVSRNHPAASERYFPLDRLKTDPFIYLDEGDDQEIAGILRKLEIRPNLRYTIKGDQTILSMVSNGLGISIMPDLMLEQCPYPLVACSLPDIFFRDIGICVKDPEYLSRSTRAFIDHTRKWVQLNT